MQFYIHLLSFHKKIKIKLRVILFSYCDIWRGIKGAPSSSTFPIFFAWTLLTPSSPLAEIFQSFTNRFYMRISIGKNRTSLIATTVHFDQAEVSDLVWMETSYQLLQWSFVPCPKRRPFSRSSASISSRETKKPGWRCHILTHRTAYSTPLWHSQPNLLSITSALDASPSPLAETTSL